MCFLKLELNDRNQLFREGFLRGNGISTTSKLQDLFFFFFQKKRKTCQIVDILSQTLF